MHSTPQLRAILLTIEVPSSAECLSDLLCTPTTRFIPFRNGSVALAGRTGRTAENGS
jgi:hypothetical protein